MNRLKEAVVHGGPPRDGIPSIEDPVFVKAAEADQWLDDDDVVFGVVYRGAVRAYPQKILVWHEIVNDRFGDDPFSITYCPLTGSAVGYRGKSPVDGSPLTFGTTGRIVNSNLLMYDRQTSSEWPQIYGRAIKGRAWGMQLEKLPVVWTRWGSWKERYPETLVLSAETGTRRPYGKDPYGSYRKAGTYYDSGGILFPVIAEDKRLDAKNVVIGLLPEGRPLAIRKESVRRERSVNGRIAGLPFVALYDEELDAVRVFERRAGGRELTLHPCRPGPASGPEAGNYRDEETGSVWTPEGQAIGGPLEGERLPPMDSFDVMWFAWNAFFPETEIQDGASDAARVQAAGESAEPDTADPSGGGELPC